MSPDVTLLTDFGRADSYVAEMKAVVLGLAPLVSLVDIVHDLPPGNVRSAQYVLGRSWHWFPPGTVHLAVVDPGVGTARRALAVAAGGHFFVAPDNGLLSPVLDEAEVVELRIPPDAAPTFHGRDVFAPAAGRLASGHELSTLGPAIFDAQRSPLARARLEGGAVVGEVIYIDRFGTLVTNIGRDLMEYPTEVQIGDIIAPIYRTFADVAPGGVVAFWGSGGTLEIAVRDGSAARMLAVDAGVEVRVALGSR